MINGPARDDGMFGLMIPNASCKEEKRSRESVR